MNHASSAATRSCWEVLSVKADMDVQACQGRVAALHAQLAQTHEQQRRMERLMLEQQEHLRGGGATRVGSAADDLNRRRFLSQLDALRARIDGEVLRLEGALHLARQGLAQALREQHKLQQLRERALQMKRQHQRRREQAAHDAAALLGFRPDHP